MTREEIGRELFEIHNRIEELRLAAYADKEFYEFLDETEKEVYNDILFKAQSDIYFNFLADLFTEEELADFYKKKCLTTPEESSIIEPQKGDRENDDDKRRNDE